MLITTDVGSCNRRRSLVPRWPPLEMSIFIITGIVFSFSTTMTTSRWNCGDHHRALWRRWRRLWCLSVLARRFLLWKAYASEYAGRLVVIINLCCSWLRWWLFWSLTLLAFGIYVLVTVMVMIAIRFPAGWTRRRFEPPRWLTFRWQFFRSSATVVIRRNPWRRSLSLLNKALLILEKKFESWAQ